jgi:general secretion pathway protein M
MNAKPLLSTLHAQLDQLSPRERRGVLSAALVLVLALVWGVFVEPAWQTIQQGPANQEALLDKANQVLRAANELDTMRKVQSRVHVKVADAPPRLSQLLQDKGIAEQAKIEQTDEQHIRVKFEHVNAAGFLAWLASAESISTIAVQQMQMKKHEASVLDGEVMFTIQPASSTAK